VLRERPFDFCLMDMSFQEAGRGRRTWKNTRFAIAITFFSQSSHLILSLKRGGFLLLASCTSTCTCTIHLKNNDTDCLSGRPSERVHKHSGAYVGPTVLSVERCPASQDKRLSFPLDVTAWPKVPVKICHRKPQRDVGIPTGIYVPPVHDASSKKVGPS
jgi:hypothetical protein